MSRIDVHLDAWEEQAWCGQGAIASCAKVDELFARGLGVELNVFGFFFAYCRLELKLSAIRQIIVSHIHPVVMGESIELIIDRMIEVRSATGREIATTRAVVGHKKGIAGEDGFADDVACAGRSVAWGKEGFDLKATGF